MKNVLAFTLSVIFVTSSVGVVKADGVASADTPSKTPAGVSFTVPKEWSSESKAHAVLLTPPEGDVTIAIVDAGAAADAAAAVNAAWQVVGQGPGHPLRLTTSAPAREGWDEIKNFDYETSPNEHLVLAAGALRRGAQWTVLLIRGSESTIEKRAAAVGLLSSSLRPGGYQRESFAGRTAHRLDPQRIAELKSFVQTGMKELGIPGVAIALSDHGKVVYEGGLGVRQLGESAPVDANTLFMIASNTKGMTTLLLARLVDEGKLRWDEPVTQAYPSFRLGSDETTKDVLIRHLVCACTGIPRKDLDWIFNTKPGTPATATFAQLANTEPTSKFGEVFQYSNLMASAAGYIAGHIVYPNMEIGAAYDRAMQTMIFNPLGMSSATFDNALALREDHASPHGFDINGHPAVASMGLNYTIVPYRPAGGAWASAHDLIKYVDDELTEGVLPNGKRLVSAENLLKRRAPSVPVGEDAYYGMGLMTSSRTGVTVVHHGGDLVGFHSDWFAIPSADVGAVILTNGDAGGILRGGFQRRLLELLYDGKPEAAGNVASAADSMKADMVKTRQELTLPADAKVLARLARRYQNADLGHIDVSTDKAGVVFDFGMWKSHVATKKNTDGTTSLVTIDPSVSGFEFVVGSDGGKRTLTTRDGQHKYVYTGL